MYLWCCSRLFCVEIERFRTILDVQYHEQRLESMIYNTVDDNILYCAIIAMDDVPNLVGYRIQTDALLPVSHATTLLLISNTYILNYSEK